MGKIVFERKPCEYLSDRFRSVKRACRCGFPAKPLGKRFERIVAHLVAVIITRDIGYVKRFVPCSRTRSQSEKVEKFSCFFFVVCNYYGAFEIFLRLFDSVKRGQGVFYIAAVVIRSFFNDLPIL